MYLVSFLKGLTFFGAISIPFFLEWGKLTYTQIFFLQSWFMFWIFALEVPTGVIADKIGRKLSVAVGAIVGGTGLLIYSIIPNFLVFLFAEFLASSGAAFISGADKAFIYDTLKEKRKAKKAKYIFANYELSETIGLIIALPLGSLLAGLMVWPYPRNLAFPMFLTFFPFFIAGLVMLTTREPKRITPKENPIDLAKKGMKHLFSHHFLRTLAFDMTLISSLTFLMYWLYQPILGSLGIDVKYYGFVGGAFNVFAVVLLSKIKFIEITFGTKRFVFLAALIPALMYLILGFSSSLMISMIGVFLITGLRALRIPVFQHYMNKFIESKNRATVLSGVSMLERIILTILYPVVGFLLDWSFKNTLIILGVITLILTFSSRVTEEMLVD